MFWNWTLKRRFETFNAAVFSFCAWMFKCFVCKFCQVSLHFIFSQQLPVAILFSKKFTGSHIWLSVRHPVACFSWFRSGHVSAWLSQLIKSSYSGLSLCEILHAVCMSCVCLSNFVHFSVDEVSLGAYRLQLTVIMCMCDGNWQQHHGCCTVSLSVIVCHSPELVSCHADCADTFCCCSESWKLVVCCV